MVYFFNLYLTIFILKLGGISMWFSCAKYQNTSVYYAFQLARAKIFETKGDLNRDTINYFCTLTERTNLYREIFHRHISVNGKRVSCFAAHKCSNIDEKHNYVHE
jgi:hypothetical protein